MSMVSKPENHKAVGERSEAIIMGKLSESGYTVLKPMSDNLRYDLLIEDDEGKFWRIQCKTGWLENDGDYIEFKTASTYYHTRAGRTDHGRKDYNGQIDYFAVYSPDTKKVYLVPIDHVKTMTSAMLRLVPTKNKQEKNIRWAKDYELE
jgi:hypothetical protein